MRLCVLLLSMTLAAPARAAVWTINYSVNGTDTFTNGARTSRQYAALSLGPAFSSNLLSFAIYDPSGTLVASKRDASFVEGFPIYRDTPAGLLDALARPGWRLDMTTTQGTSRYAFTPNLAAIDPTRLPRVTALSPGSTSIVVGGQFRRFAWTMAGSFTSGSIYPGVETTWYPIDMLPLTRSLGVIVPREAGVRTLQIGLDREVLNNVPISAALVSGVDQGSFSGSSRLGYTYTSTYTVVVPEPAALGLVAAVGLITARRRPRRGLAEATPRRG